MALSGKYGKLNIPKIDADEPVFILRAQDVLAKTAIQMYQLLVSSHLCSLADDLNKEIQAFQKWPGPKKLPD
ncbi:MAG: hypothetical protein CO012_03595 [Syntrophobacterales bacterium CG_4_8_14_3_um_filter_49_14]|nr:MAG: hypothetical protein COX52_04680 [Syntrophobacterales bacterium CG23_combo_of_CG06-09_8_20_14_all_48_27]PJA50434.1 MAG: hypothetical protein CO171_01755 [Syntrophobacterales bacterium CG_4_9_14_3_um_filter_49_8]PJC75320.1 MAG: hypothetical protein CO012_03595 [Syntrophobacterales bacterium CG_4_8_14_3_um_filter_49_14]